MTTDTALALLREARYHMDTLGNSCHDQQLRDTYIDLGTRITATLQSIKDAGDDVVEPETYMIDLDIGGEQYFPHVCVLKEDYDTLLSAYKRVCVEREQFRKDAERYRWLRDNTCENILYERCGIEGSDVEVMISGEELDSAIDSARNK